MPGNKKPRKKYKPKQVMLNAHEWAVESATPLTQHDSYVVDWTLKNNAAFEKLMRGEARRAELDVLIAARNICEAISVTKFSAVDDDTATLARSETALKDICARANAGKGTAMKAAEMQAIRDLMVLHDTLLENVSVREFEIALAYAKREIASERASKVKGVPV